MRNSAATRVVIKPAASVGMACVLVFLGGFLWAQQAQETSQANRSAPLAVRDHVDQHTLFLPLLVRIPQPSTVVINEVLFLPENLDGHAWIELFNATAVEQSLAGWMLGGDDGQAALMLPAWRMPAHTYLLIRLTDGVDDADFADGVATFFTRSLLISATQGSLALMRGPNDMADYLAWSESLSHTQGSAHAAAAVAVQWSLGQFIHTREFDGIALTRPLEAGASLGRDADSTDNNDPSDWAGFGGVHALQSSPGARNWHDIANALFDETALARGDRVPTPTPQAKKPWTVMVLMDPRDGTLATAWLADINKMERAGSDANLNIVVQYGYAADATYRYHIVLDGHSDQKVRSPTLVLSATTPTNPGDPATLASFITWSRTNYPADHYALVLAGHGQGWKGTMIIDGQDALSMTEVSTGMAALGSKFDVVFFYSCLMGMVEVGYQVADQAKYMVASEEITYVMFPWTTFINSLKATPGMAGADFADAAARSFAQALTTTIAAHTTASVDLAVLKTTLAPAVNAFASALRLDVADFKLTGQHADNAQLDIDANVRNVAQTFVDRNYLDLRHFAQLAAARPLAAAALAPAVQNALAPGAAQSAIRVFLRGRGHPNAHGLSIYFPEHETMPDRGGSITSGQERAFDHPRFGRHLYQRDEDIRLPRLLNSVHPMADDAGFLFPPNSTWDEFLHRYYKPVADACIIKGTNNCVDADTLAVGQSVMLTGDGSSDSDGPEDTGRPAHLALTKKHYYWDLDASDDNVAGLPAYADNSEYTTCSEDCDRDEVDAADDDNDAAGVQVLYTCTKPGTFVIRLTVWDEHHDQPRRHVEDKAHNRGRHWLHFNVDSDTLAITCVATPTPTRPHDPPDTTTSTPSPSATVSPTPTATATATPTPTPTATATATQVPVLTGISSVFTRTMGGPSSIRVHVVRPELDNQIYDLHIVFAHQMPPWPGGSVGPLPPGWNSENTPGGITIRTETNPLRTCQPIVFEVGIDDGLPPFNFIRIYATDQNHNIIGEFASQKVSGLARTQLQVDANWDGLQLVRNPPAAVPCMAAPHGFVEMGQSPA